MGGELQEHAENIIGLNSRELSSEEEMKHGYKRSCKPCAPKRLGDFFFPVKKYKKNQTFFREQPHGTLREFTNFPLVKKQNKNKS